MQITPFSGAAVLLALAPSALALGVARVVNNCGIEVQFASVASMAGAPMSVLPANGFAETYSLPGVGVSIKLAPNDSGAVTQFEYTWADGKINYDISNINGNPFAAGGMELVPSMSGDSNFPSCQPVSCPAGQQTCAAAYNAPDDIRTLVCDQNSDLTMTLCPGGHMKRDENTHAHGHRMHPRHLLKA